MQRGYTKIDPIALKKIIYTHLSSHSIHNEIVREIKIEKFDPLSYEILLSKVYKKIFSTQ